MDSLERQDLRELISQAGGPFVSIYQPTHRAGADIQQDPIRLKNLIREAAEKLKTAGMRAPAAKKMLKPASDLLNDGSFWRHQEGGLALFVSPEFFRSYRLPIAVPELAVVTGRFHLKPLLPLFSGDGKFYILALSQNQIRFLEGSRYRVNELDLQNVPTSLAEALKYDVFQKDLQFRTRMPATAQGKGTAIYYGSGAGGEDSKNEILRYFQQVDRGIGELLRGEKTPLVLAGVEYLFPIYKEASTHPFLAEEGILGNPEGLRDEELHEKALKVLDPFFRKQKEEAADRFRQAVGTGKASGDLREIVPAAYEGRVDSLFVTVGLQRWGRFDPAAHAVELHPDFVEGDEDLLDFAAVHTFVNGGAVYASGPDQMPDKNPLAALFRY